MLFSVTRFAIYKLPQLITNISMAFVSLNRILEFLNKEERVKSHVIGRADSDPSPIIDFKGAVFSWNNSIERPILQQVDLQIKQGQLVAIMGRVASGKSTLLQGFAGELNAQGQCVVRTNSMSYLPQVPWILNRTLRDNIIFDAPEPNMDFYSHTLHACELHEDLKLLPAGDLTEIGERGINLSGGQKSRVALARAVFQQADLYIVDDPFSALDKDVGAHVFQRVFGPNGLLSGTTRVIALNSTHFLPFFDSIVYLEG